MVGLSIFYDANFCLLKELVFSLQTDQLNISIIVPFHNRSQDLKKCVECLLEQDCPVPYEIILCDDGSTEDVESVNLTDSRKGD
jgi:glycosyltransferase involved in cell wall biosynthesis